MPNILFLILIAICISIPMLVIKSKYDRKVDMNYKKENSSEKILDRVVVDEDFKLKLRKLKEEGKVIEAIKLCRDKTGLDLKTSKNYIDNLETITFDVDEDFIYELKGLIAEDRKIQAIKLYRETTGVGLKEAKDYIENLK